MIYGIDDSYNNLLLCSNYVSIHQRNLRLSYNLKKRLILNVPRTHSTYYGTNTDHFRGSLVWNNLPAETKSSNSVFEFKTKISNLGNIDCGCLICR